MKRYIRTKDGKIIPSERLEKNSNNEFWVLNEFEIGTYIIDYDFIIKQADTIEELIMVGDLVRLEKFGMLESEEWEEWEVIYNAFNNVITELYTKQGNNFILVARKENGEWRVIYGSL